MNDNVYKIAIAAYLHDIGKFAQRAGFEPGGGFLTNNAGLYQPYNKIQNKHTHVHAVYTAAFIEKLEKLLPEPFNGPNWGLDDPLINLAAGHHKPETPLQWIVAVADRVASGYDRAEFEDYNSRLDYRDFRKTRLIPLFEQIDTQANGHKKPVSREERSFRYPLTGLSFESIFPSSKEKSEPTEDNAAKDEYKKLFDEFLEKLRALSHKDNIPLWMEHFDSLFQRYGSSIPAATVEQTIPDVSLYDHSRLVAALAVALYLYHTEKEAMEEKLIRDYAPEKFLVVEGSFYGIQKYIFDKGGDTNRAAAKLLRGRSLSVSIVIDLSADLLCQELGIPSFCVLSSAAGKFTLIAPNTTTSIQSCKAVEEKANKWLFERYFGEVSIGIHHTTASCSDFCPGKSDSKTKNDSKTRSFDGLFDELMEKREFKKFNKFNPLAYCGTIPDYLDKFENGLESPICRFCGKRPSSSELTGDPYLKDVKSACLSCRDHIFLGTELVKNTRLVIARQSANLYGDKLKDPIFGEFQLSFDIRGNLTNLGSDVIHYWDIDPCVSSSDGIGLRFIKGYIPKVTDEDLKDNRFIHGRESEEKKL